MSNFESSRHNPDVSRSQTMVDNLQDWASMYADSSGGRMHVLPYDPSKYPGQEGISVKGDPKPLAIVDSIAEIAHPRYHELRSLLVQNETETNRVSMMGELLVGGANVVMITNHGDLIDIAIAQAAVYSVLESLGYQIHDSNKKDHGYDIQTGIIISKMIAFLAYKLGDDFAPCTDVLTLLENETYLSYPRTESTKKHLKDRLRPDEIKRHNRDMRNDVIKKLKHGSLFLGLAASGTTDKPAAHDPSTIIMGKIGMGTLDILKQDNTFTMPMAVWYKGKNPVMEFTSHPHAIKNEEDARQLQVTQVNTLNKKVANENFAVAA